MSNNPLRWCGGGGGGLEVWPAVSRRCWPTAVALAGDCCAAWAKPFLAFWLGLFLAATVSTFSFSFLGLLVIQLSLLSFTFSFLLSFFPLVPFFETCIFFLGCGSFGEHIAVIDMTYICCETKQFECGP